MKSLCGQMDEMQGMRTNVLVAVSENIEVTAIPFAY
jgi:hypothetical protein